MRKKENFHRMMIYFFPYHYKSNERPLLNKRLKYNVDPKRILEWAKAELRILEWAKAELQDVYQMRKRLE